MRLAFSVLQKSITEVWRGVVPNFKARRQLIESIACHMLPERRRTPLVWYASRDGVPKLFACGHGWAKPQGSVSHTTLSTKTTYACFLCASTTLDFHFLHISEPRQFTYILTLTSTTVVLNVSFRCSCGKNKKEIQVSFLPESGLA